MSKGSGKPLCEFGKRCNKIWQYWWENLFGLNRSPTFEYKQELSLLFSESSLSWATNLALTFSPFLPPALEPDLLTMMAVKSCGSILRSKQNYSDLQHCLPTGFVICPVTSFCNNTERNALSYFSQSTSYILIHWILKYPKAQVNDIPVLKLENTEITKLTSAFFKHPQNVKPLMKKLKYKKSVKFFDS